MEGRFPEVPEGGFRNRDGFKAWLDNLNGDACLAFAPILAVRAAIRASVFSADEAKRKTAPLRYKINSFRANSIAWVAVKYPTPALGAAAVAAVANVTNAVDAAYSTATAAAYSATAANSASAAATATTATNAAASAATAANAAALAAAYSATAAAADFWRALTDDASALIVGGNPQSLHDRPLWLTGAPEWWLSEFERFKVILDVQSPSGWQVWIGWLQCRVDGVPSWQLPEEKARAIEERIALGDGREDFWEREPEAINTEILGWLSEPSLYDRPERQRRPAIKMTEAKAQATKEPAPKKQTKSKSDDATITIAITENDLSIPENEIAAKPEQPAQNSDFQPASKRADLEPLADTVDGSVDHLGRANIAYALAGRINEVWDQMNRPGGKAQGAAPGFVIHIDAPWGGGKSTFAEHIAQILNPYIIKGALPAWLKALPIGKDGTWPERFRRPWHIVRFNAWQHQHVTPPWWVFYETIRETVTRQGAEEANRQEAALPAPSSGFAHGSGARRWFGATVLGLREYAWRLFSPSFWFALLPLVLTVVAIYLLVKFGVIQTVQKDGKFEIGIPSNATGFIATTGGVLLGGGAALWRLWAAFTQTLLPGTPDAAKNFSLGSGDPLKRMKAHFVRLMERVHRPVLVIVDDLDRCEPAFVVELVRGMQTILASPRVVYLLLGDRDWIEQSFTEVHKAMKGVEVGPEHRFGGRFVEKAIQFSMVLPDVSEAGRQDYVRQLLTTSGRPAAAEPVTAPPSVLDSAAVPESQRKIVEDLKADAKAVLETDDYEQRERKAKSLADKFDLMQVDLSREAFDQEMAQKLFFRAATDSTAEKATAHMIEGMASILPANPRQIKRIINTLSLLGQVLRIKDPAKRPGSADWQMLARWVVLMVEWPKSWFTLTRYPGLADMALAMAQGKSEDEIVAVEMRVKGLGFLPATGARPLARLISANPTVMRALDFLESDWVHKPITGQEIEWLREVMPAASGQVLQPPQQEKPASADAVPTGKAA